MQKMQIVLGGVFLAFSACSVETISDGLAVMKGQNVEKLFQYWGLPNGEGKVAGKRYYVWTNQFESSITLPRYNTANVYGNSSYYGNYGYYGTAYTSGTVSYTTYETTPIYGDCKIRVFFDRKKRITEWDGGGNEYGCEKFATAIYPLAKNAKK